MINVRVIILSIIVLFLCSGCLQNLESPSTSKEEYDSVPSIGESGTPSDKGGKKTKSKDTGATSGLQTASVSPAQTAPQKPGISQPSSKAGPAKTPPEKRVTPPSEKTDQANQSNQRTQLILDEALDFCQAAQDFWQKGELDNAIEALDQAYSLVLKIDDADTLPELLQQKEDLRFTISKRILEIYASRNIVVNGKHNEIPITLNHHTMAEVYHFTKGKEKNFFKESYRRSGRYHARIVKALRAAGLPDELSWLPLIESGFKVNALSRARALGLWQFIPSTGYKFGLKRDYYMDERLDPEKATQAAIDYLKELHQIFGDWTTVLAAYNCGEGRVLRVIRNQNVNYLDNFWDLYERLPRETARYVPRFLATLYILQNPEKNGLDKVRPDPPLTYETVSISRSVHLRDVARKIGVSETSLKNLNPELRYNIVPPEAYSLKVPDGKKNTLLANLDDIPVTSKPKRASGRHRVRRGETLSTIARKYRTNVNSIARANNIHRRNYIVAGQTLNIPQKGTVVYRKKKYKKPRRTHASTHVVKSGDSLWIIAKQYGTTTKQIQKQNNIRTNRLQIGQILQIPGPGIEISTDEGLKTYRVRSGDSPFGISKRHNMPLERFLRINHLTPRSKIYPGQSLFIE